MKKGKAVLIIRQKEGHQITWIDAFAEGLKRHGWQVKVETGYELADLVVIWGTRKRDIIGRTKADGGEICILERGYLGDRFFWTSVSFGGGLNGRGEFRRPDDYDGRRFYRRFGDLMRPWHQPEGGYALLIGQVPGDMSLQHVNIESWYSKTARALEAAGWNVLFREHPLAGRRGGTRASGLKRVDGSLEDAMRGARLVVTYNSNAAVEAALFGRPVIAMDEGSMAWQVAGHEIGEIIMPYRADWAARLAWCQWSDAEMRSGECMEAIRLCQVPAV